MKPPLAKIDEVLDFLPKISEANSEKLEDMLVSAKRLLGKKKYEESHEKLRVIIEKIEARYIPLRQKEIQFDPQQYWC